MPNELIGSLTAAYTATEVSDGKAPPLGYIYDDGEGNVYEFVQNEGSDDLAENRVCKVNDASSFDVEICDALNDLIAGVRPDGAESLEEDECGYIMIKGTGKVVYGASAKAIVAGEAVVADDDGDKGKCGGVDLDIATSLDHDNIEASLQSMHAAGQRVIAQASTSTTDVEVECLFDCPVIC